MFKAAVCGAKGQAPKGDINEQTTISNTVRGTVENPEVMEQWYTAQTEDEKLASEKAIALNGEAARASQKPKTQRRGGTKERETSEK